MIIFMRLLMEKLNELNFTQIQRSKCRENLKLQTNEKEEKFVLKMYLIKKKPCNLLPKLKKVVNKHGRWEAQNRANDELFRKK